jgi:hypothetical protein
MYITDYPQVELYVVKGFHLDPTPHGDFRVRRFTEVIGVYDSEEQANEAARAYTLLHSSWFTTEITKTIMNHVNK